MTRTILVVKVQLEVNKVVKLIVVDHYTSVRECVCVYKHKQCGILSINS